MKHIKIKYRNEIINLQLESFYEIFENGMFLFYDEKSKINYDYTNFDELDFSMFQIFHKSESLVIYNYKDVFLIRNNNGFALTKNEQKVKKLI
ncbi:MAG: hypothetical protein ACOC3V_04405 [bacterium]